MDIAKQVVVRGGASGLGEATVRRFAALGAKIAVMDLDDARGEAIVGELGIRAMYSRINVADEVSVQEAINAVVKIFGGADLNEHKT